MKKCIALILSLIYLSTTSGMVMNVQYCFDEIASVNVEGFGKNKCCCTNSSEKAGCCTNELKVPEVDVSYAPSAVDYKLEVPVLFLDHSISYSLTPVLRYTEELLQSSDNSPPFTAATPIHIKNCVFRI